MATTDVKGNFHENVNTTKLNKYNSSKSFSCQLIFGSTECLLKFRKENYLKNKRIIE